MKNSLALSAALYFLTAPGVQAADCHYTLTTAHLLQCRPIKLIENEIHKALWTYVEDSTQEGVIAHILCSCDTSAASGQSHCEAPRTHKLTFTTETQDIRETCGQGPALCQAPCLQLLNH